MGCLKIDEWAKGWEGAAAISWMVFTHLKDNPDIPLLLRDFIENSLFFLGRGRFPGSPHMLTCRDCRMYKIPIHDTPWKRVRAKLMIYVRLQIGLL